MGQALMLAGLMMLGIMLAFVGLMMPRKTGKVQIQERLSQFAVRESPKSLDDMELERSFSERIMAPLIKKIGLMMTSRTPQQQLEQIRKNIMLAGNPPGLTAESFLTMRIVLACVLGGLGVAIGFFSGEMMYALGGLVLGGGLGYMLPGIWLGQKMRARKKMIMRRLPDALDLMTICLQAGASLDRAMSKVVEKDNNASPIAAEYRIVLKEMNLGRPRVQALRAMAERCQTPDTDTFISSIVQADLLGLPLVRVLEIQSKQMRLRRRQRAEEAAHQAPIKMLFPMIFLIFPSMFIVILGPAVPAISQAFSSMGQ